MGRDETGAGPDGSHGPRHPQDSPDASDRHSRRPGLTRLVGVLLAGTFVAVLAASASNRETADRIDPDRIRIIGTGLPTTSEVTTTVIGTAADTGQRETTVATRRATARRSTAPARSAPPTTRKRRDTPAPDEPAIVDRPIPEGRPSPPPAGPEGRARAPWASTTRTTAAGYVATDVGCASDTSAAALDDLFDGRLGPIIGHDYQHVYPLGGDRYVWLFQDTFVDHGGAATTLDQASFAHNTALLQEGVCFTLLHRGNTVAPASFEPGTGEQVVSRWFWPLGGETVDGTLHVFWAEMVKDGPSPGPGDGLGWHPVRVWLGSYDAATLERRSFRAAPDPGVSPLYGYAVASDDHHTYLFGNTFDQNLARQGGYHGGPHSATAIRLARVPRGRLDARPEYRTQSGWSDRAADAAPISTRFWAENPMQPRYLAGRWIAATKVDGYWGEELTIDVAPAPWGPWTAAQRERIAPRGGDPLMNTYHAHLLPWTHNGSLVVSLSHNARNMERDAWPEPRRYGIQFRAAPMPGQPDPVSATSSPRTPSTTAARSAPQTTRSTVRPSTTQRPARPGTSSTTTTTRPPAPTPAHTTTSSTTTTTTRPSTTSRPSTTGLPTTTRAPQTSTSSTAAPTTIPPCATTTTTTTTTDSRPDPSASSTSASTTSVAPTTAPSPGGSTTVAPPPSPSTSGSTSTTVGC